jgi:hypothetical protein
VRENGPDGTRTSVVRTAQVVEPTVPANYEKVLAADDRAAASRAEENE